jgi:hypothetical protein
MINVHRHVLPQGTCYSHDARLGFELGIHLWGLYGVWVAYRRSDSCHPFTHVAPH